MDMRAAGEFEPPESELSIGDYLAVLKRRRWHILLPAAVVALLAKIGRAHV